MSYYLWIKSFHIISFVCWFAALFYLPRLFVYHSLTEDHLGIERFKVMERKLYRGIALPAMVLTLISGFWLLYAMPSFLSQGWLHAKLTCVLLLIIYQFYCGYLKNKFAVNCNTKSHNWYRFFNEIPTFILLAIVILVTTKPF